MYWLFLLLALGAFMLALTTTHMWLLLLSLLATLLFFLLWIWGLYAARFSGTASQAPRPLHPAELQVLREQLRADRSAVPPSSPDSEDHPPS